MFDFVTEEELGCGELVGSQCEYNGVLYDRTYSNFKYEGREVYSDVCYTPGAELGCEKSCQDQNEAHCFYAPGCGTCPEGYRLDV